MISRLSAIESGERFIRRGLTNTQYRAVKAFYEEQTPEEYEAKHGLKAGSFQRVLKRALQRLNAIVSTEEFKEFHFVVN